MTSAQYILQFRETYHLSRHLLAYYTGISTNLMARFENGEEPGEEWWESLRNTAAALDERYALLDKQEEIHEEMEELMESADTAELSHADPRRSAQAGEDESADEGGGLSAKIVAARKQYGLTGTELAGLLGISRSRLSQIEHGDVSERQGAGILRLMETTFSRQHENMPG